ncbi:Hpt domain-containing protein [Algicola sagamiensis]|uniref:Hpt domain-containing protein n=1 Tax=Algicola sagamiensis TaxID=163869 RepID=UPI00035C47DE|nr:Hpt domain-containing protein [Algicola sagamiensis]
MELKDICDTQRGLANACGNQALYHQLLQAFIKEYHDKTRDLETMIESEQNREAKHFAHTIKGVANTLGFIELSDISDSLQSALNENDIPLIRRLAPHFCNQLEEAVSAVKAANFDNTL